MLSYSVNYKNEYPEYVQHNDRVHVTVHVSWTSQKEKRKKEKKKRRIRFAMSVCNAEVINLPSTHQVRSWIRV